MSQLADRIRQARETQRRDTPASAGSVLALVENQDLMRRQVEKALPMSMRADHFARVLLTECRKTPRLLECSPESFLAAVMTAAQLGLEPGPLGLAYLVPYRNTRLRTTECQLIIGYRGFIELARRSRQIESLSGEVVYEKDRYRELLGSEMRLEHERSLDSDPGPAVRWYAVARFTGGGVQFKSLTKAMVERYRARSRAKDDGPWVTDYDAMAMKTAMRRLAPFLPLTVEAAEAIVADEQREYGTDLGAGLDLAAPALATQEQETPTEQPQPEGESEPQQEPGPAEGVDQQQPAPAKGVEQADPGGFELTGGESRG